MLRRTQRLWALTTTIAGTAVLSLAMQAAPAAAVTCPNGNPVVQENACSGAGTTAWQLTNPNESITGYATASSYAKGQDVALKIARGTSSFPATAVDISVYRMGYYGGTGGRLIAAAGRTSVPVNNTITCNAPDTTTGRLSCSNWAVTYTIPGSALPATGVYLAKLRATDTGYENSIVFTVRDTTRSVPSAVEMVVPTATYQAYNNWGGKSLYFDAGSGQGSGFRTIAGTDRAVKVSFDRPTNAPGQYLNRFINGPDRSIVFWLEQQGYDVTYTDDYAVHANPAELRQHRVVVLGAHAEYWSGEELAAFKGARDAGTSILSLGGNTGYWKVRYEDGGRTLVCYKTVQGTGTSGTGTAGVNDWGPDGVSGTADDALGADGVALTADDHPENATTTFRDNGAPPGDPNAPASGRVGPDTPENSLLGNMYVGDNDSYNYPLVVPAADAGGQYAGDRIWRNTGISTTSSTTLDSTGVGWEWDAVPAQAQYLAKQPAGVKRVTSSPTASNGSSWLQDEGRVYGSSPPAGQPGSAQAVKYQAASGAWVFAAGTCNWGLALDAVRVAQATYNMLSDMGVQPATPDASLKLDGGGGTTNQPPTASFTGTPASPVAAGTTVTVDASASSDPDGTITMFEWDLDGNGTYETITGTTPRTTTTFTAGGSYDVHLRVTDNAGATAAATRTYVVSTPTNQPPAASFTGSPASPVPTGTTVTFDASASSDPDGTIAKYEWDLDGNGTYEATTTTPRTATTFSAAGSFTIGLRVTDNGGATATATRTYVVQAPANQPPTAGFTASPNPARTGQVVAFDASASRDPDGTIARYDWDLDGNGTYETSTGTTPRTAKTYTRTGTITVRLRVTDGQGATATASTKLRIQSGPRAASAPATVFTSPAPAAPAEPLAPSNPAGSTSAEDAVPSYATVVRATSGLAGYWRMDERSGTTLRDASGSGRTARLTAGRLGAPTGLAAGGGAAVRFGSPRAFARAPLDLSAARTVTVELWLVQRAAGQAGALALEHTPDSDAHPGGFFAEPNAGGGRFRVGFGRGAARSTASFPRPRLGRWHHYAFVFDARAPVASQITVYVDGAAVASGVRRHRATRPQAFARSALYFMARGGRSRFCRGTLDEVAVYTRALTAREVAAHHRAAR